MQSHRPSHLVLVVFNPHVLDGLLNRLLRQHRAMQLNGRQFQIAGNIRVFYLQSLLHLHAFDQLSRVGGRSYRGTTSKCLNNISLTLNTAFSIVVPSSFSYICNFITSPQAGAPTSPVPTFFFCLSIEPTFLGFS